MQPNVHAWVNFGAAMVGAIAATCVVVYLRTHRSEVLPVVEYLQPSDTLSAMAKAHPGAETVCYDSKHDAYFLHHLADATSVDRWYYVDAVPFWRLANNTVFTKKLDGNKYVIVYPDVTGLPCKSTKEK